MASYDNRSIYWPNFVTTHLCGQCLTCALDQDESAHVGTEESSSGCRWIRSQGQGRASQVSREDQCMRQQLTALQKDVKQFRKQP